MLSRIDPSGERVQKLVVASKQSLAIHVSIVSIHGWLQGIRHDHDALMNGRNRRDLYGDAKVRR